VEKSDQKVLGRVEDEVSKLCSPLTGRSQSQPDFKSPGEWKEQVPGRMRPVCVVAVCGPFSKPVIWQMLKTKSKNFIQ
jgi:hypothetical protein